MGPNSGDDNGKASEFGLCVAHREIVPVMLGIWGFSGISFLLAIASDIGRHSVSMEFSGEAPNSPADGRKRFRPLPYGERP